MTECRKRALLQWVGGRMLAWAKPLLQEEIHFHNRHWVESEVRERPEGQLPSVLEMGKSLTDIAIAIEKVFQSLKLQIIRNSSGHQLKIIINKIQNTLSHKNPAEFQLK
ncbi:hypothetical protein CEXT_663941 [Caerostris extrusa]|uniref:Uncharacterized protein n=1 Tax=Caerostris extrusa TaxID=172846 RepID=A0AAV4R6G7_CAEEX|nr:hypothetical protein CEXT_663941 [Caerostris extrusa]